MKYISMSIEDLEALCADLYSLESDANKSRKEIAKVLSMKYKLRDAGKEVVVAKQTEAAAREALYGPTILERIKRKVAEWKEQFKNSTQEES